MALSESEVRTFEFRYIDFVMDFIKPLISEGYPVVIDRDVDDNYIVHVGPKDKHIKVSVYDEEL